jgi:hypothetical protein
MAAGAILPPLFFERRRLESIFAPRMAFSGTFGIQEHSPTARGGSPLKDI